MEPVTSRSRNHVWRAGAAMCRLVVSRTVASRMVVSRMLVSRMVVSRMAMCCVVLALLGESTARAQEAAKAPPQAAAPDSTTAPAAAKVSPEKLESLVAPIALYPDPLLAQTLVASTYPLELVQLQQWLAKHPNLKDKALADSVAKQPWDPAIQSMAAVPEVVKRLADDIQWTTDLGNAFLAQQEDVMDSVQRMRKKAKGNGALESNEQQKVETQVVEKDTVIVVVPSDPDVIYVPSYSPTVVYGPPVYPYPPIYYPPYPPGAAFVSFSIGFMWGAAAWGGPCCGCGWGGGNVNINVNNNFNRVSHHSGNRGGGGNWQHNPQHRGGAPYGDRATATKYGGSARGDSPANRQAGARQQGGRPQAGTANRGAGPSVSDRSRSGAGSPSAANRSSSPGVSDRSRAGAGSPGVSNRSGSAGRGGSDHIGSRNIPRSSGSRPSGGFSGGSRGYSGGSARASSARGASSMGGRGGGGRRR